VFGICLQRQSLNLTFGTDALVATARKALFAMRRRCALLGIQDPALQCKLFDTSGVTHPELWLQSLGHGRQMLCSSRSLALGVSKTSVRCQEVYSKPHAFHCKFTFGSRFCFVYHRIIALDNMRLVSLAMVDGFALKQTAVKDSCQHYPGDFLHGHSG